MNELSPFDLVMGTPEDAKKRSEENFEHQCIKQLLRGLGATPKRTRALEAGVDLFTCSWFESEFSEWEVVLSACRVREYSLQDLFERPAKNAVVAAFNEAFAGQPPEVPKAMFFKAVGWTKLVIFQNIEWITEEQNYLNLCAYGVRYRVCPLEEFIDAYPRRFLAPEAISA